MIGQMTFHVQGSSHEPYAVTFVHEGTVLNAECTCPAGQNGSYCKHRLAILSGDSAGIVSDNAADISLVLARLKGSKLEVALGELTRAERSHDEARKLLAMAKKNVSKAMRK